MIVEPPLVTGGENVTVATLLPATAVTDLGELGTLSSGVTAFEADEGEPFPTALTAMTVNVYDVPALSPETIMGLETPNAASPPGLAITL